MRKLMCQNNPPTKGSGLITTRREEYVMPDSEGTGTKSPGQRSSGGVIVDPNVRQALTKRALERCLNRRLKGYAIPPVAREQSPDSAITGCSLECCRGIVSRQVADGSGHCAERRPQLLRRWSVQSNFHRRFELELGMVSGRSVAGIFGCEGMGWPDSKRPGTHNTWLRSTAYAYCALVQVSLGNLQATLGTSEDRAIPDVCLMRHQKVGP
jgi:hypothetical protein